MNVKELIAELTRLSGEHPRGSRIEVVIAVRGKGPTHSRVIDKLDIELDDGLPYIAITPE